MQVFDLKDKKEYIKEVMILEHNEWGENPEVNFDKRIDKKIKKYGAEMLIVTSQSKRTG